MAGFLNTYFYAVDAKDFEKTGYRNNPMIAMLTAHQNNLLAFITPKVDNSLSLTASTFKLKRMNAITGVEISSANLDISKIVKKTGTLWDYFYYDGLANFGTIGAGTYHFELKLSDNRIINSEYFCVTTSGFSGALGDFNIDFGDDFFNN
jgi:hypothetical protein